MRTFVVTTECQNRLGLRELCERYVNDEWFPSIAVDGESSRSAARG